MILFAVLGKPQDVDLMVCTDLIDQVAGEVTERGARRLTQWMWKWKLYGKKGKKIREIVDEKMNCLSCLMFLVMITMT